MKKNATFNRDVCEYISAKADGSGEGDLYVYGDIRNTQWWDDDVTPKGIRDALNDMGEIKTLNLRINSLGGDVFAGNAIINIIEAYRKKKSCAVNAYIDGIAASMGSNIPMVADKIYMAANSLMMLHKPLTFAYGNANDLGKTIEMLDKAEETLVNNYMRHYNGDEDDLRQMLSDETWLTADEALGYGLCDEVLDAVEVAASASGIKFGNVEFKKENLPADFIKGAISANKAREEENRGMKKYKYDDSLLERFGIDEEAFASLGISSDAVAAVMAIAKPVNEEGEDEPESDPKPAPEGGEEEGEGEPAPEHEEGDEGEPAPEGDEGEPATEYVSEEAATEALGESVTAEAFIALAIAGHAAQRDADKAKAYDKIFASAVDEAIKNGVRAKGENFNEERQRKILNLLTYEEVVEQSQEWAGDAKDALKAGMRVTNPDAAASVKKIVRVADHKF